jgi:hypothetical protein
MEGSAALGGAYIKINKSINLLFADQARRIRPCPRSRRSETIRRLRRVFAPAFSQSVTDPVISTGASSFKFY